MEQDNFCNIYTIISDKNIYRIARHCNLLLIIIFDNSYIYVVCEFFIHFLTGSYLNWLTDDILCFAILFYYLRVSYWDFFWDIYPSYK